VVGQHLQAQEDPGNKTCVPLLTTNHPTRPSPALHFSQ
jgi:hypothetical protein